MQFTGRSYAYESTLDLRYSPIYERQVHQCTLAVPGGGCVYYRAHEGDVCPFCAFPGFSRYVVKGPGFEQMYKPWTLKPEDYKEMYSGARDNIQKAEKLAIFNGGSFFPNSELPQDFQTHVYEDVARLPNIIQLMVESYPDYISEKKIIEAKSILGKTDLMVAIGFESVNDHVRNTLLKKRIDKEVFEKKVKLLQRHNVQVFVYVFLKAPGLSEQSALQETLNTIQYLYELDVDEIALSCAFVPPDTLLEKKYLRGQFRPPWLWTILQIAETAQKNNWPLSIGGFSDTPKPVAGPMNCGICDPELNKILDYHRIYGKLGKNNYLPKCGCRDQWINEFNLIKTGIE